MEERKESKSRESSRRNEDEPQTASDFDQMIERSREWIRKIDEFLATGDGDKRPER